MLCDIYIAKDLSLSLSVCVCMCQIKESLYAEREERTLIVLDVLFAMGPFRGVVR